MDKFAALTWSLKKDITLRVKNSRLEKKNMYHFSGVGFTLFADLFGIVYVMELSAVKREIKGDMVMGARQTRGMELSSLQQ